MQFLKYHEQIKINRDSWTPMPMKPPLLISKFDERIAWLKAQQSPKRFILHPIAGTFWFEDKNDALMYRMFWLD